MILLFQLLLARTIYVVEPEMTRLLCNEYRTVEHPDDFGLNMTITLGAYGVPCFLGGIRFVARRGECACLNEDQIIDDGTWEACAFRCHRNNTMQIVKYLLDGMTEDFPLVRHTLQIHLTRVSAAKTQTPKAVELTNSWESKIEDFIHFASEHWFFIIILEMLGFSRKKVFQLGFAVLAIAYWSTHFGVAACEDVLHYDTLKGENERQMWMTLSPAQCKQVGLESAKRPVVFGIDQLEIDQGMVFQYLIPFKLRIALQSEAPCPRGFVTPGFGRPDNVEFCKESEAWRCWALGCFNCAIGKVCTFGNVEDYDTNPQHYAWVFNLQATDLDATLRVFGRTTQVDLSTS